MILSNQQIFSDQQAITGTAASENVIDLGDPGTPVRGNKLKRDIGKGEPIPVTVIVTEDFDDLTSLAVQVQVSSDEAFTSPKTVQTTVDVPLADLKKGYRFNIDAFMSGVDDRYLRLNYVVTGTNPTSGAVTAGISMGNQTNV